MAGLPYLALGFGLLFGWYFGSTRMLLSLLTLTFANQAWATWPLEKDLTSASYTIFAAATFLLPLNFLAFSILKEEAIGTLRATLRLLLFLFQPFVVLWLCDPANRDMAAALTTPTARAPAAATCSIFARLMPPLATTCAPSRRACPMHSSGPIPAAGLVLDAAMAPSATYAAPMRTACATSARSA